MITRSESRSIWCDHPGCKESITMPVSRDTPLRATAQSKGWTRVRGPDNYMEDRCPNHGKGKRP